MLLRNLRYYLIETISNLSRNRQATTITVLQTLVSLFMLGIFLIIIINTNRLVTNFINNLQVAVFLNDGLDADQTSAIYHEINDRMPGIKDISYRSKEDAMTWVIGETNIPVEDYTDRNPLPASFLLIIESPKYASILADMIGKIEGVDEVMYGEKNLGESLPVLYFFLGAAFVLAIVIAGATVFTISNTIRLAIYARRKEIRIMQLVGATEWAIRGPFLFEGLLYGLVGSVLAFVCVMLPYTIAFSSLSKIWVFRPIMVGSGLMAYNLFILMVVLGVIIGAAGSLLSVDRYLESEYPAPEAVPDGSEQPA
jgi:cell division transport system permease protein